MKTSSLTTAFALSISVISSCFLDSAAQAQAPVWTLRDSGTTANLYAVTQAGGSDVVAVGAFGTFRHSTDAGATWSGGTTGPNDLFGVTYTGTRVVAVGGNGRRSVSDDHGNTWSTELTSPTGPNYDTLNAVCYGGEVIAVGDNGTIKGSTDAGETWTLRTSNTTEHLRGIAYNGGVFVAVGDNGTTCRSTGGGVWTVTTVPGTFNNNDFRAITWTGSQFVAVGGDASNMAAWTSPEGSNWTFARTIDARHCVTWTGYQVVAGGISIYQSPTGSSSWVRSSRPTNDQLRGLAAVPGAAVIAVALQGGIATTTDLFEPPNVTLTVAAQPLAGGTVGGGGSYASGTDVTATAQAAPGYYFVNWTEDGNQVSTSASYLFNLTGNRSLVANFALHPILSLVPDPVAGGTVGGGGSHPSGTAVTATAQAAPGYYFVNWTEGINVVSANANYGFTLTANRSLTAHFAPYPILTVAADPQAGGTVGGGGSYPPGFVTATAQPAPGYSFVNWTEGGTPVSTTASYLFNLTADRSLIAHFVQHQPPVLTVTPPAAGKILDFGWVPMGKSSTVTFTLRNPGTVEASSIAVTKDGTHSADFIITGPAVTKLAPGARTTFTVTFTPAATGGRNAAFHVASKPTGSSQVYANIDIDLIGAGGIAPVIETEPVSLMVPLGAPAQFSVTLDNTQPMVLPITYQWQKNGANIAGATAADYTIQIAALTHAGTYKCIVKNAAGSKTSGIAELGVISNTKTTKVVASGTMTTCTLVSGGNGQTFAWQKVGGPLPAGATGAGTKTLTLKSLMAKDTGTYECVVSGPGGPLTGGTTEITVFDDKPELITPVVMPDAYVSGSYTFPIPINTDDNRRPTSYTATGLPRGLACGSATGIITGKASESKPAGYDVVLKATNAKGSSTTTTKLMVHALDEKATGVFNALVDRDTTLSAPIATPAGQKLQGHGGSLENLVVTASGDFTAKLMLEDKSYSMPTGTRLDAHDAGNPTAHVVIKRGTGIADLTMDLEFNITTGELTGTLTDGVAATPVNLQGWRNSWKTTSTPTSPANPANTLAGSYTSALEFADNSLVGDAAYPQGNGYGTLTITSAGIATWTGVLADGTPVTRSTTLGPNGEMPLHWMLYTPTAAATAGSAHGWVQALPGPSAEKKDDNMLDTMLDLTQALPEDQPMFDWLKKPQPVASTTRSYKSGIPLHKLNVIGGGYVKPDPGNVVLGFGKTADNAKLTFGGANVETSVTYLNATNGGPAASMDGKVFTITTTNAVIMPKLPTSAIANPATLTLTLNATTGAMSGGFTLKGDPDPTDHVPPIALLNRGPVMFNGLLVPRLGRGVGCFQLQQLPDDGPPKTTLLKSPLLSGQVLLETNK